MKGKVQGQQEEMTGKREMMAGKRKSEARSGARAGMEARARLKIRQQLLPMP
jgi:hypothetical protein